MGNDFKAKIAGVAILLIVLIIVGDFITGAVTSHAAAPLSISGCNNPASLEQCGNGSCTPTGSLGGGSCAITVNFNPPFASIPTYVAAQIGGCHSPECHPEVQSFPLGSITLQSDNGETWANMPAATTEVYGTTNHEVSFSSNNPSIATAEFSATCIQGSSSATATLRPQFSTDGGGTWRELAGNPGLLDIPIDATDCSFASSPAFSTEAGINPAATSGTVIFRIVGFNGNGAGDNVILNNLQLVFFGNFAQMYLVCIIEGISPGSFICPPLSSTPTSKTQMIIGITRMAPATSGAGTAINVEWIAKE